MKNKIYYLGIISTALVTAGGIFKIMHWPGAGIILTLGLLNLCFIFFPIAFINSYKNSGRKKKWLYIAAFITVFSDFIGALFKIMHWPGAGKLLIIGIISPVVIFLPVYIYHHVKDKEESIKNFMYIMFFLVYLSGMSALLAVNVTKSVLDNSNIVAELNDISDYYKAKINTYNVKTNEAEELIARTDNLLENINDLKIQLLLNTSKDNKAAINENHEVNVWMIKTKDNVEAVIQVMLKEQKATILKKKINEYTKYVYSIIGDSNPSLINCYNKVLNTQSITINEEDKSWEYENFNNLNLTFAINKLTELENYIKLIELETLYYLSKEL